MSVSPTGVNTAPIRKAYDEINTKVNGLNGQVRNYNIKTAIKIALFMAGCFALGFGLGYGVISIAMSAFPTVALGVKVVTSLLISIGLCRVIGEKIEVMLNASMKKTQNEFLSKINIDFKRACDKNSNEINNSIFFYGRFDCIQYKESKSFIVQKIELAPFEEVKEMYIEIEKIRRQEEQNSGFSRFLPSFLRRDVSA
ncbi:MAG: hypothetical protein KR126chlam4_01303 [Candidatus Anoxychlamydiales bacterium]|nr:hypothetical protein [Candidatus Anoxychlamydiales bacterium]HEU64527.1 hypothetical protein [Chlamydiota bacterium]